MEEGFRRSSFELLLAGLALATGPLSDAPTAGAAPARRPARAQVTLTSVYHAAEQTLRRSGKIYTATIRTTTRYPGGQIQGVDRVWVDVGNEVGRTESSSRTPRGWVTEYRIDTPHGSYLRYPQDSKVTPATLNTCYGTGIAVSVVLGCPGPTETSTTQVRFGRYGGKAAVVLVKSATVSGEDSSASSVSRLYLDPGTSLPIVMTVTGKVSSGRVSPYGARAVYTHHFVDRRALPAHLFDPASIGYRSPETDLNHPPAGFTVYWLGAHVPGTGRYPALTLYQVETAGGGGPGYYFILHYGKSPNPVAQPLLDLQDYPAGRNGFLRSPNGPCRPGQRVALAHSVATIHGGSEYSACAYFPGTTVFISVTGGREAAGNPYDSPGGMLALVRALQPRTPTR
ncbi:MAG: hypothetical protein JOZ41_22655 [Chloroflexi bacterium]|nr:hypothetical protein [Chloroflexota bacterium]